MHTTLRLTVLALLLAAGQGHAQGTPQPTAAPRAAAVVGVETARPKPVRYPAFYSTEVTVSSQNAGERRGATIRALGQVLVRLTGDMRAAENVVIRRARANIDSLVVKSEFRQDSETVNGVPVYKTVLSVSFDPEAVDALIAGGGLRYWSNARPKPLLWLAIDDGRGARLVTGQQTAVVKPLAARGLERGMRFLLPSGTAQEQAATRFILAMDAAAMQPLTARYRNDTQLLGKVYRQAPGWAADWLLTQDGVELARWSFSDANPRKVIASGVDDGANALARRDARAMDSGIAGLYQIDVIGVNSQADFLRLMGYLQSLALVRRVTIIEAGPGQLRAQLDLAVGMKGFRTMLASGGILQAMSDPASSAPGQVSRFLLQ